MILEIKATATAASKKQQRRTFNNNNNNNHHQRMHIAYIIYKDTIDFEDKTKKITQCLT